MDDFPTRQLDARIALLQIARTGGTTLHSLLVDACDPGEMLDSYPGARVDGLGHFLPEDIEAFWTGLSATQRLGCRLLAGHIPFGFDERLQERFAYACVLRDPVERLLSGFLYGTPKLGRMQPDQLMFGLHRSVSLAETAGFDNSLTRVLAGTEHTTCSPSDGNGPQHFRALGQYDLDLAVRRLTTRFAFVGLSERFEDSCRLLFAMLGKRHQPSGLHLNATLPKLSADTLPLSTLRLVERRHAFDLTIYDAGRRIFNEHAEKAGLPIHPPLGRRTSDVGALTSGDHAHTVCGDAAFGSELDGVWLSAQSSTLATQSLGYLYPIPVRCRSVTVQLASHLGGGTLPFRVEASRDEFAHDVVTVSRIAVPADMVCHRLTLADPSVEARAWRLAYDSTEVPTTLAIAYLSFLPTATSSPRDIGLVRKRLETAIRTYRVEHYGCCDEGMNAGPGSTVPSSPKDPTRVTDSARE